MAYIEKLLTESQLSGVMSPEAMKLILGYFSSNPMKTVFKITDRRMKVTVTIYRDLKAPYAMYSFDVWKKGAVVEEEEEEVVLNEASD